MKKLIAVIIVAIVIVGGAYWVSGMMKKPGASNPSTSTNPTATTQTPSNPDGIPQPAAGSHLTAPVMKGPIGIGSDSSGSYITNKSGITLYVNQADVTKDKITPHCDTSCEKTWVPFLLGANEVAPSQSSDPVLQKLNLYKRPDGKLQYALGVQVLYTYVGDKSVGDMKGAAIPSWAVAKP